VPAIFENNNNLEKTKKASEFSQIVSTDAHFFWTIDSEHLTNRPLTLY
jgi:hypothetical protein